MSDFAYILIFFVYGLAFFSMGLVVALEGNRASDTRLRKALRPLAAFGLLHGLHEWMDMFRLIADAFGYRQCRLYCGAQIGFLAISFISLASFGGYLFAKTASRQRLILLLPLGLETIWVFGLLSFSYRFSGDDLWAVADVWTRYTLGIPAALLAAVGLIVQQRYFRQAGLWRFGRDAMWAAISFGWYGLVGQLFTRPSLLPPSTFLNRDLFLRLFGFPIELFRAASASLAAMFIVRFMRSFQVEIEQKIAELQAARLEEARRREALRGELYQRVIAAQEAERQRIARDLHDETGQALTAIGLGLRGLSARLQKPKNLAAAMETLRSLEELTQGALRELQRLIADLRPSHLDDLGLPAAIRWYANSVQAHSGLKIHVEIVGEEKTICSDYMTTLFRIFQEALTNVVKHAHASNVAVQLCFEPALVRLRVEDDGQGFDAELARRQKSWGLLGMQERATLLDGEFHLHSAPGRGTVVEVAIPYCPKHREEETNDDSSVAG
ncbi:MAG: sensor histidine kinase [Anaerolineae bacterium]|nr:MAG: sensor histidine kinase [Anaerolineae bacterium]